MTRKHYRRALSGITFNFQGHGTRGSKRGEWKRTWRLSSAKSTAKPLQPNQLGVMDEGDVPGYHTVWVSKGVEDKHHYVPIFHGVLVVRTVSETSSAPPSTCLGCAGRQRIGAERELEMRRQAERSSALEEVPTAIAFSLWNTIHIALSSSNAKTVQVNADTALVCWPPILGTRAGGGVPP